jgi:hypothetical protein
MISQPTQEILVLAIIIVFVLFILVFSFVLKAFDARFSYFLSVFPTNIKNINSQLTSLLDVLVFISTILKPSCVVLRKYIINIDNALLKDMYLCSQIEDTCQGEMCCCTCMYQSILYVMSTDEELQEIAILCKVGGVDIINAKHGICPLYMEKSM